MAAAGAPLPPWDPGNTEEEDLIYRSDLARALDEAGPTLAADLKLDKIWPYLKQLQVLETNDEERIKHCGARPDQALALLSFIKKGPRWQYHALMRTMALTGQRQLIPKGGPDPEVYIDQVATSSTEEAETSSPEAEDTREPLDQDLLRIINDHCKSNKRCLKRRHIFAFDGDPGDDYIDITPCYINVHPKMKDQNRVMVPIAASKVLEKIGDSDPPLVIRLYAQPGDGKTSFTMNIAYSWSVKFMEQLTMKDGKLSLKSKCPFWTTMVFIKARDIKTTMEDAIREGLGCKEDDEETMMAHIKKGEGVAILVEAMDELHDQRAIEELKKYVEKCKKKGGPTVLITSRTDLCSVDGKDFDRFLTLEGFSEEQALQYVKLYTETCKVPQPSQSSLPSRVYEHVTRHKEKMKVVLSNPLQLHLYCALVMRGEIELSEKDEFSLPKLFCPLERYLLKRGGIKVTEDQSNAFYQLCMHAILNDIREFPSALLDEFNIVESYHVFLNKSDRRGHDGGLEAHYSFGHEVTLEFFASRYILSLNQQERLSFLLVACCDETWRNIQTIIFQMLVEEGDAQMQLMLTMIRSILILQFKGPCEELDRTTDELVHLQEQIKAVIPHKDVLRLKGGKIILEDVDSICAKINDVFDKQSETLRAANWLTGVCGETGTFNHVVDCLKACSPHLRDALVKRTILPLMPGKMRQVDFDSWQYAVGGTRWALVNTRGRHCGIHAWCPADAAEALLQHATLHPHEAPWTVGGLHIKGDYCALWGQPDGVVWSTEMWNRLLHLISPRTMLSVSRGKPTVSIIGSLSCFLDHAEKLSQCSISVADSTEELNNLVTCVSRCRRVGLNLVLYNTHVTFTDSRRGDHGDQGSFVTRKPALAAVVREWRKDRLHIELDGQTSLTELLSHLLNHAAGLSQCEIMVSGGKIELGGLMSWAARYKEAGLKLKFLNTAVSMPGRTEAEAISAGVVLLKRWTTDQLEMELDKQTPVDCLLSRLLEGAECVSQCKKIIVGGGTIELDGAMSWAAKYKEAGLNLEILNMNVSIREAMGEARNSSHGPALRAVLQEWAGDKLKMALKDPTSHTQLMSHPEHSPLQQTVHRLYTGPGELEDLVDWITRCNKAGLKVAVDSFAFGSEKLRRYLHIFEDTIIEDSLHAKLSSQIGRQLSITVSQSASLVGLLSHLLDYTHLTEYKHMSVSGGAAEFEALMTCLSRFKQQGVDLTLHNTCVIKSPSRGICENKVQEALKSSALGVLEVNEIRLYQKYLTMSLDPHSTDLTELLSHLSDSARLLSHWALVEVVGGTAKLQDLIRQVTICHQNELPLILLRVVVPDRASATTCISQAQVVVERLSSEYLEIVLQNTTQITDVLLHIYEHAANVSSLKTIRVSGGTVRLADVMPWLVKCKQAGLGLVLDDPQVILPEFPRTLKVSSSELSDTSTMDPVKRIKQWTTDVLSIVVQKSTPLTSLLSWLLKQAAPLSQFHKISVEHGTAQLGELMSWLCRGKEAGLDFELQCPSVVLSDGSNAKEHKTHQTNQEVHESSLQLRKIEWIKVKEHKIHPTKFLEDLLELRKMEWIGNKMRIALSKASPITCLLSCLLDNVANLACCDSINVTGGSGNLGDLVTLASRCREGGLKLELHDVCLLLPDRFMGQEEKSCTLRNSRRQDPLKLRLWRGGKLRIEGNETIPLSAILPQLLDYSVHLTQCERINITGGTAELDDLMRWVSTGHQAGLRLELGYTRVIVEERAGLSEGKHCEQKNTQIHESILDFQLREWTPTGFSIRLYGDTPLAHFIPHLLDHTIHLSQYEVIDVYNGTAELQDLGPLVSRCRIAGLRLVLQHLSVIVPETLRCLVPKQGESKNSMEKPKSAQLVVRIWSGGRLTIEVGEIVSHTGLLSHLCESAATKLPLVKEMTLSGCFVQLDDILHWIHEYEQAGLKLTFEDTKGVLPVCLTTKEDLPSAPQNTPTTKQHIDIKNWTTDCLSIILQETAPLTCFLRWFTVHAEHLSQCTRITVRNCTAELPDLLVHIVKSRGVGLELEILDTSVVVSDGTRDQQDLLQLQRMECAEDKMYVSLHETFPLAYLLICLVDHTAGLSSFNSINVTGGAVFLDDLVPWVFKCRQAELKLVLQLATVLVRRSKPIEDRLCETGNTPVKDAALLVKLCWWSESDQLHLHADLTTPLTVLLSHLLNHAELLSQCKYINVAGGEADLNDLITCVSRCRQVGLKLSLWCENVTTTSGMLNNADVNQLENILAPTQLAIGMNWVEENLRISLGASGLLVDVLSCLTDQAGHLPVSEITVESGTADLDELMSCISRTEQAGLTVRLRDTRVLASEKLKALADESDVWDYVCIHGTWTEVLLLDEWDIDTVLF